MLPSWSSMHASVIDITCWFQTVALQFCKALSLRACRILSLYNRIETTQRKKLIDRLPIFPSHFRRHTPYYTHPDVRIYELNRRLQHRIEVSWHTLGSLNFLRYSERQKQIFSPWDSSRTEGNVFGYFMRASVGPHAQRICSDFSLL